MSHQLKESQTKSECDPIVEPSIQGSAEIGFLHTDKVERKERKKVKEFNPRHEDLLHCIGESLASHKRKRKQGAWKKNRKWRRG